jgi:branched-chain amino acid aminotransferase
MIAYVSGEYVPHEEAKISVDDRGIIFGDSVFDIGRTFNGVPFKLEAHLERLRRSMRYAELDGDGLLPAIREATNQLFERNEQEIEAVGDVYFDQIVTRGLISSPGDDANATSPTVIVKLRPVPFASFARFYETGVDLHASLLAGSFAGPMDPRVKAANRLANTRPELKGERMSDRGKGHWTVILNPDGSISETHSANLAIVSEGRLVVPPRHQALGGISLATVRELAEKLGIPVDERIVTTYDIINADETFITATSFSILPVVGLDGIPLRDGRECYSRLLQAWKDLVGIDFVAQALDRAGRPRAEQPAATVGA